MELLAYLPPWSFVAILLAGGLASAVKIVQEYERGVIFRLGRLAGARGPGLFFIIPVIDQMVRMDLRTITYELPPQEIITRDNVTIKVTAVVYFRILNPEHAVTKVENYHQATVQIAMTTLRNVLGQSVLDEILAERAAINLRLQQIIDEQTEPWGLKVSAVEIKDVELPATMQRAMARQAEAEREKRAKIIHAEGELQAAAQLASAAQALAREPMSMQLRYLATLNDIAAEKNSTIVFPLPVEFLAHFLRPARPGSDDAPAAR